MKGNKIRWSSTRFFPPLSYQQYTKENIFPRNVGINKLVNYMFISAGIDRATRNQSGHSRKVTCVITGLGVVPILIQWTCVSNTHCCIRINIRSPPEIYYNIRSSQTQNLGNYYVIALDQSTIKKQRQSKRQLTMLSWIITVRANWYPHMISHLIYSISLTWANQAVQSSVSNIDIRNHLICPNK